MIPLLIRLLSRLLSRRLALAALALPAFLAHAQYQGPAVEACRSFAKKDAEREGMTVADIVFERDATLVSERYGRKIGTQFVRYILTGNGAVVLPDAPSAELSFICLLAEDRKPVFFNWLPRQNVAALAQCRRDEQVRAEARSCLELLLRTAELDLGTAYAHRFQEANERGGEPLDAYRKSNDEWRQYRDAECERRRTSAPAGVTPEEAELACRVEVTRQRMLDLR